MLEAGGDIVWVRDEAMLDAVTGVSGSGPAYVFYFLEALEEAARGLGFSAADARRLAYATFEGAIALAKAGTDDPATLRAQVTSKGGTTERAVSMLEADAGQGEDRRRGEGRGEPRPRARRRIRQGWLTRRRHMDQALRFLLDTAFGLLTYAFLLRFMMQWLRAPFRNPAGQAITALTDWAVKPLRRVLPGFKGQDTSTLVLAWLRAVRVAARDELSSFAEWCPTASPCSCLRCIAVVELLKAAIWVLIVTVIVQAVLSWVGPDGPLAGFLNAMTFPLPRADPPHDSAARRHARPLAADPDRARCSSC